jgi:glycosyltransferase involved in cell wall biosynthesis
MSRTLAVEKKHTLISPSRYWVEVLPPIRKVIFNQNAYNLFARYNFDAQNMDTPYFDHTVVASIVVSLDSQEYVRSIFPNHPVHRIRNAIDPRLFYYQEKKNRQIAFMPRKHRMEAEEVLNYVKFKGALEGYSFAPIDNVSEDEVARIMWESLFFVSFGYPEGFSLPPAEAMACGCIVVGYHGGGGREYFLPEHSFPINSADTRTFERVLESVLQEYSGDPSRLDGMRLQAARYIASEYSFANEESDILAAWRAILG